MILYDIPNNILADIGVNTTSFIDNAAIESDDNIVNLKLQDIYKMDANPPDDIFSVAAYLVDRIAGKHNQDVMLMLNGDKGTGKSNLSISLGHHCAVLLAKKLGGHWTDYFNINNIAVMDTDHLVELFDSDKKYQIIISDDGGIVNDCHHAMRNESVDITHMIIAMRPKHNIYIVTVPDQGNVNKTERETADFIIQMTGNVRAMNRDFTVFKFKKRIRDTTNGRKYYMFLYKGQSKILRCVCPRAPRCLEAQYDALREQKMKELTSGVRERRENDEYGKSCSTRRRSKKSGEDDGERKLQPCEIERIKITDKINERIKELKYCGMSNKEIKKEICNEMDIKIGTWEAYIRRGYIIL